MRPLGDEANMGLVVSQFLSWSQNKVLGFLQGFQNGFPGRPDTDGTSTDKTTQTRAKPRSLPAGCFITMLKLVILISILFLAFFVVYGIISLYALIGLLLAALPFGPDAMFWNLFTSTTAEPAPVGESPAQIFHAQPTGGLVDPGLAHSGIYTNPVAIAQIVSWIKHR